MKIDKYSPDSNIIIGTLSDTEKKIIDAVFDKAKPGDTLEIELLDKKGFISEEKVKEIFNNFKGEKNFVRFYQYLKKEFKLK